ncbi:MAG: FliA/WhiG family RNA polymerase sigma factor [Pseudomonadota bacterium]
MAQGYQKHETRDAAWREEQITHFAYLVKHIAAKFARRVPSSVFFDELISAGSLGLIDAVDKFDPNRHVSLKTYAQYRINGAILDELRGMDVYSRAMRKKIQEISQAVRAVEFETGKPASESDVAKRMGLEIETYYDMLTDIHGAAVLSLDTFLKSKNNEVSSRTTFQTTLKNNGDPEEDFDRKEVKTVLADAIRGLSEKEQLVVSLYYYDELTLKEIGEVLDLTESRICQIHTSVLIKLKARLNRYFEP